MGSQSHLAGAYFLLESKFDAEHVPYKGDPPAAVDMMGGVLDYAVLNLAAVAGHIEGGRMRALGLTTASPLPLLAKVPLISEVVPGFDNSGWFGLVVPKGTPAAVVDKTAADTLRILADPQVRERLVAMGFSVIGNSPQENRPKSLPSESAGSGWCASVISRSTPERRRSVVGAASR